MRFSLILGSRAFRLPVEGIGFPGGDGCRECRGIGVPNYTGMPKIWPLVLRSHHDREYLELIYVGEVRSPWARADIEP